MSDLSPLSGVKRKSNIGTVRSAFDPERTSATSKDISFDRPRRLPDVGFGQLK